METADPHADVAMDVEERAEAETGSEAESSVGDDAEDDDLSVLMRAWVNERGAPELLEYEGAALENLMELVEFQTQRIASQPAVVANILRMDVDRVKYLVRSYLRARLAKIERHTAHYLGSPEHRARLSQNELDYAQGFAALEERHLRRSFLDQLDPHLRRLDETAAEGMDMVPRPDLDAAVFCRVRATVGEFQFDASEDPIVMRRNNIFITRYSIVRSLLADGKVELI
ncbi:GINS complex subunit [Coemansia javaensis]|uniref:DNA replication complex GINS protein SLD5 n=1 Tax=Coemansia javaensis TaxID=2761396 RepID=A0A9W8LGE1_9FUNG|nr:GINS complex subunit [Coemansia javaensis]KAJ2780250.1 GINS complex subunit [Coemansia javaensis]